MKTSLLKGLDEQEKKELEAEFIASYRLRQQMIKHLEGEIQSIQYAMRDLESYEKGSWPMYQADRLGQIRAYEKLISLFS